MLSRIRILLVAFIVFLFAIFLLGPQASTSAQPVDSAPDAIDGHPVWDDVVVSILGTPGEATDVSNLGMPQGNLGWDKATNQPLSDPSSHHGQVDSLDALALEKNATLDSSQLIFRSGYKQPANSGLDQIWLAEVVVKAPEAVTYSVIQFQLPFDTNARLELEAEGVRFYNYVEGGGLYARVPTTAVSKIQSLEEQGRVLYAGSIPSLGRIEAALLTKANTEPDAIVPVSLQFFDVPETAQMEKVKNLMEIAGESLHPTFPILDGSLRAGDALALVDLPYVRWLETAVANTPGNLESVMGLGTDVLRDHNTGSDGTNINVGVIDTGIANPYHNDLPASRVTDQWEYYPSDDATANDTNNHGTHVAGTIGGDSTGRLQGHGPDVDFLIYKLCCNVSGTGFFNTDFQDALTRGANNDMHISNNSWGGGNGVYNTAAEIADRAVRGEYGSQYINMVIISHNDNALSRSPGTAKNAITVGAVKDGNWPNTTFSWSACSDTNWSPGVRVCFSNFGPIDIDGDNNTRVKPDVMAPGVRIRSTIPGNSYDDFDGTSMAAPGVSGALGAVLDHYDESNSWLLNWPETVKAMTLVNAVDVGGNTDLYGRGMVSAFDMSYFIPGITGGKRFWGNTIPATSDTWQATFDVPAGYEYVDVALTWPDPAGAAEVSNDLDVRLYSDSNCTNLVSSSTSFDDTVEFMHYTGSATAGTWCVKVTGYSLSTNNQSFGLATNAVLATPSVSIGATVDDTIVFPSSYIYYYTTAYNSGNTAGGGYVRINAPAGLTILGGRVYADDGRSHYYMIDQTYESIDGYKRIAVGELNGHGPRLVRWFIEVDSNIAPGNYNLLADAYYRNSGSLGTAINSSTTTVTVPTAVSPYLTIAPGVGSDADLAWTDHAYNCLFNLHADNAPYFTPQAWNLIAGSFYDTTAYSHTNALGNPNQNWYYVVQASNCGTSTADSNDVGEFDYKITPGN